MNRIELQIGEAILTSQAEAYELRAAEPTIREAFRLFAEQLQQTPFSRFSAAGDLLIESLQLSLLPFDELLGPRGAERLADALYREFTKQLET